MRLNRIVAVGEVKGVETALCDLEELDRELLRDYGTYHAVRADLLRRSGRRRASLQAYDEALAIIGSPAKRHWPMRKKISLCSVKFDARGCQSCRDMVATQSSLRSTRAFVSANRLKPSASIGVYRPQAESFGGRCDGKFGVPREEVSYFQVFIRAGDN